MVHTVYVLGLREVTLLILYSVSALLHYKQLTIYSTIVIGVL